MHPILYQVFNHMEMDSWTNANANYLHTNRMAKKKEPCDVLSTFNDSKKKLKAN